LSARISAGLQSALATARFTARAVNRQQEADVDNKCAIIHFFIRQMLTLMELFMIFITARSA